MLPHVSGMLAVSPRDGALPALYAATAPECAGAGGSFYGPNEMNVKFTGAWQLSSKAATPETAKRLLDDTLALISSKGGKLEAAK
jgi:hypothetical protein